MIQRVKAIPIKILLLGDYGVGKTSLINTYLDGENFFPPIQNDYRQKQVSIGSFDVNLQFWDPAGQQQFKKIGKFLYRNVNACIFVYDLTNPQSLQNIPFWMNELKNYSQIDDIKTIPKVLVGNKLDLIQKIKIKNQQVVKIKEKYPQMTCYEASAVTGQGIDEFLNFLFHSKNFLPPDPQKYFMFSQKTQKLPIKIIKQKNQRVYRKYQKCC